MFRVLSRLWESFKEYIILILLLIASLIILSLNQNPGIKQVRALAFGSFAAVTSVVSDVINISKLKSENTRLRKVNAELMLQLSKLRDHAIVNEDLRRLLAYKDTSDLPLIPAEIVSRSLSKSQSTITLSAGSDSGVEPGMPVINDQGLIGVIHSTSNNFSIARILTNRDLKLTVKDERSRVDGILKWNGENLVIVDVPKTYDIEPGDRIITSDLSSIVSIPLPVGVVTGLSKVETGIFNEVTVKPFVDISAVEYVFIAAVVESKQKNDLELNFYKKR